MLITGLNQGQVAVGRKHIDAIVSLLLNKKNEPDIIFQLHLN